MFLLVGTAPRSVPQRRVKHLPLTAERSAHRSSLDALKQDAIGLLRQGRYTEAQSRFDALRKFATALGELDLAARALMNVGYCQFAHRQYQPALHTFLEARCLAQSAGDTNATAIVDANVGSLYRKWEISMPPCNGPSTAFENMSGEDRKLHLHEIQISLAAIRARQNRMPEAIDLFCQGIDGADRAGNLAFYTVACNRLGEELLRHHFLPEAESALLEAYRVRKLHHLPSRQLLPQSGPAAHGAG